MQELIDKQASMKAICDGCFKSRAVDIELKCRGTCNVIDILQQQPTIEAEPVRHGRRTDKGEYAVCTECGGRSGTQYDGVEPIALMARFCPNCGARMDGGADND